MRLGTLARASVAVAFAASFAGCEMVAPEAVLRPDLRQLVITVENGSPRPATLVVARDTMPIGANVGTATPASVPAGATVDVRFGIPRDDGWAIFVNPGPNMGPLITAFDVPDDAAGKAPVKIVVNADGSPGAQLPAGVPGWFGN